MAEPNKDHRRSACLRWLAVALWACVIFYMSSRTGSNLSTDMGVFSGIYEALMAFQDRFLGPDADLVNSIAHFCEYTVLGVLLANALRLHLPMRFAVLVAVVCASGYGVTDELHQMFVPTRMCDPLDWLTDTAGGALGAVLTALVVSRRERKG